jgi:Bacterial SH3 domain
MLRSSIVFAYLAGATAALGEPVSLDGETIRRDLVGGLLKVDTPLHTQIPIRIGSDGLVSAEAGALASMLGSEKDRGRWWIEHDQLCTKWFRWFDAKTRCISLQRDGNRIYWQEAGGGEKGTATLEVADVPTTQPVVAPQPNDEPKPVVTAEAAPAQPEETSPPLPVAPVLAEQTGPALQFSSIELSALLPSPQPEMSRLGADDVPAATAPPPPKAPAPKQAAPKRVNPAVRIATAALERHQDSALPETGPSLRVARVGSGDELNVRSGPSEFHQTLGTIPSEGRGVRLIGDCDGLWCPVRYGYLSGWVNANYLAEEDRPER